LFVSHGTRGLQDHHHKRTSRQPCSSQSLMLKSALRSTSSNAPPATNWNTVQSPFSFRRSNPKNSFARVESFCCVEVESENTLPKTAPADVEKHTLHRSSVPGQYNFFLGSNPCRSIDPLFRAIASLREERLFPAFISKCDLNFSDRKVGIGPWRDGHWGFEAHKRTLAFHHR